DKLGPPDWEDPDLGGMRWDTDRYAAFANLENGILEGLAVQTPVVRTDRPGFPRWRKAPSRGRQLPGDIRQALILRRDYPIALAGLSLEDGAIGDFYRAARLLDGATARQALQSQGYSRSPDAEHHGQKVVRQRNGVAFHAIMSQEQRSRETL